MSAGAPIEVVWDGNALVPTSPAWVKRAARQFTEGEVIHVMEQEPRSMASHGHYFARVTEVWKNLPHDLAERFPSADHLRRYALIKTGCHNSQSVTCTSHAAALKLASFIRPLDEFAVISVQDCVVTHFIAKTQSLKMGNKDFQASKTAVLEFLSQLIGVTPQQLADNAGKAA